MGSLLMLQGGMAAYTAAGEGLTRSFARDLENLILELIQ